MSDAIEAAARAIYEALPNYGMTWQPNTRGGHSQVRVDDTWDESPDRHEDCRRQARAAIAAYEAAKGGGVGVKPLEWEEFERGSGAVYAISIFGRYSAWREGEYGRYETPEGYRSRSIDRGIDAAMSAAQADYESRIRSVLTSPANGERNAVIEECAKVADGIAATHRSIGKINLPSGGGPIIQEDRARVAEACAADIRALRMEGK